MKALLAKCTILWHHGPHDRARHHTPPDQAMPAVPFRDRDRAASVPGRPPCAARPSPVWHMPTWKRLTSGNSPSPTHGASSNNSTRVPSWMKFSTFPPCCPISRCSRTRKRRNGLFVLTGSEQFRLSDAISQSLAGRTALLKLLPFSLAERQRAGASDTLNDILFSGFYPRIHDQGLDPRQALGDYFETYVERDVRRIGEIRNLSSFRLFVRLCAGRVGQLANLSSLGADAGVSHTTARGWLTVLEASYIVFQLPPFHANIRKRLIRSPKLYFYDVGLASYLLGIRTCRSARHPSAAWGALRERGRRRGAEAPFQPGRAAQPLLLPRCAGSWSATCSIRPDAASEPSRSNPGPRSPLTTSMPLIGLQG